MGGECKGGRVWLAARCSAAEGWRSPSGAGCWSSRVGRWRRGSPAGELERLRAASPSSLLLLSSCPGRSGRRLVLGVFLLDVEQEFLWLRRQGWCWSLAANHRCHRPRVGREHWGDGGRGKERGGRAGRQECRAVPVHGGG